MTSWALSLSAMDEFADNVKPTTHRAREGDVVAHPVNRRFHAVWIQVFLHLYSSSAGVGPVRSAMLLLNFILTQAAPSLG